nr:MAG TPA: hypothetical protein [Bacteriophage sp.]
MACCFLFFCIFRHCCTSAFFSTLYHACVIKSINMCVIFVHYVDCICA